MSARTMSPDLIAFLKAWYDWATNGAPDNAPFSRDVGLCSNASLWGLLHEETMRIFGQREFPFGQGDYHQRWRDRTQHECPKRLAWVRERLVEAGELVA